MPAVSQGNPPERTENPEHNSKTQNPETQNPQENGSVTHGFATQGFDAIKAFETEQDFGAGKQGRAHLIDDGGSDAGPGDAGTGGAGVGDDGFTDVGLSPVPPPSLKPVTEEPSDSQPHEAGSTDQSAPQQSESEQSAGEQSGSEQPGSGRSGNASSDGQGERAVTAQMPAVEMPVVSGHVPVTQTKPNEPAMPVSASNPTVWEALDTHAIGAVPEIGPITTSMPVLETKTETDDEVRAAAHRLEMRLRGSARTMRRREIAAHVGISLHSARKLWRALGLPRVSDDQVAFTMRDQRALDTMVEQVRKRRLSEDAMLSIARSIGQLTDRMAIWQIEALVEDLVSTHGMSDPEARRQVVLMLDEMLDPLLKMVNYSYQRNLAAAIHRQVLRAESGLRSSNEYRTGTEDDAALPLARAVGFADMVSFTSLSRGMDARRLARLVQNFEARCASIISTGGGRLVKTIGDEVLYVAETPQAGARIALTLARAFSPEEDMPEVRVGLVWGRILSRLGDIYGATVNMAARLTAMAEPGQVLIDSLTSQVLDDDERFVIDELSPVELQGFGAVTPFDLSPGPDAVLPID